MLSFPSDCRAPDGYVIGHERQEHGPNPGAKKSFFTFFLDTIDYFKHSPGIKKGGSAIKSLIGNT